MGAQDVELEELVITVTIRLTFHELDLVVGALQRPRRDRIIVVVQDALLVSFEGGGKLLQHPDSGTAGASQPLSQDGAGLGFAPLHPDLAEILLEIVSDRQRFVDPQGAFETLGFLFLGVEVFRILQEQPAGALEELLALSGEFMKQLTAEGAELVVVQLDDVEVIEPMNRPREILTHSLGVSGGHVGGHGFDLGVGAAQTPPEGFESIPALAVADEDDGTGEQIVKLMKLGCLPMGKARK